MNHRVLKGAVVGLFLSLSSTLWASPIDDISAMVAKPKILCGQFDQRKQLAGMTKPLLSEGRFCVQKDKGVLWRTLKPFANSLTLTRDEITQKQGDRVSMRLSASKEPTVRVINEVLFSLLSGDLTQLGKVFHVDAKVAGNRWTVNLDAREPAVAKAVGRITLEGGAYVKSIVMNEPGGDKTEITFSDIQTGDKAMNPEEVAAFKAF